MNIDQAKKFASDWLDAWNNHDIERIVSHYESKLEFKSPLIFERYPSSKGVISDSEKLREYFSIGLAKNPELRFRLLDVLLGTDGIILYYENAKGGHTAELFEFGKNEKIVRSASYYG